MSTLQRSARAALLALAFTTLTSAAHAAIQVLTFGANRDATLYANAVNNANGAGPSFLVGTNGSGQIRRGLLQFDLSAIQPGSIVQAAALTLFADQVPNITARSISLRPVTEDWTEGTTNAGLLQGQGVAGATGDVTWASRSAPTAWTTAGGSFGAGVAAKDVSGVGSYEWRADGSAHTAMLSNIQAWIDQPHSNLGWALLGVENVAASAKRFVSREGDELLAPRLTLTIVPVPEPSEYVLLGIGLAAVAFSVRRARRAVT